MRTMGTSFNAAKNRPAGSKPVWILTLPRTGTTPLYLSDKVISFLTPEASWQTTKAWVSDFGNITEGITNGLGEISVGEFDLHILADPADDNNIVYQIDHYDLETGVANLMLWFDGIIDPAIIVFPGYIKEISIDENDAGATLRLQDATLKLQGTLGTVVDTETYPLADPDHVGKLLPIVFNHAEKIPAVCVDAGWVTALAREIASADYFIEVSEVPASTKNKTIYVDEEQLLILNDPTEGFQPSHQYFGGIAWANSEYGGTYVVTQVNNGDYKGANGAYWQSATGAAYNHLTLNFKSLTKIYEFYLFSLQDNYQNPADVNHSSPLTGSLHVIQDFDLYYCIDDNYNWQLLKQVRNNDKIVCRVALDTPVVAARVLIVLLRSPDNAMRVVEAEAWGWYETKMQVTRGVNSTIPTNHAMGATVIEKKATPIVFLAADDYLTDIGEVFIRVSGIDVNISNSVTKYLGTLSNQLAAYPGKAAITIDTTPSVMQQLYLTINNALNVDQGNHTHPTSTAIQIIRPNGAGNVYGRDGSTNWNSTYAQNCWDGNASTGTNGLLQYYYSEYSAGIENQRVIKFYTSIINPIANLLEIRVGCICQTPGYNSSCYLRLIVNNVEVCQLAIAPNAPKGTYQTGWFALTDFSQIYNHGGAYPTSYISLTMGGSDTNHLYDIWFECKTGTATTYSPASGVALTGDLSLTGNNVSNVYTMDALMVNAARSDIATPLQAINYIQGRYGYPAATGSSNITTAINGAIITQQSALYWLARLAFESWALFKPSLIASKLIPRGLGSSVKPISNAMIRKFTRRKSAYEDIINKIDLKFEFDYSNSTDTPYRQTTSDKRTASQSRYGIQDRPDLFNCNFITSSATAVALRDAYLNWYSDRHWIYDIELFLDNIEIEYGDTVTLEFVAGSPLGVVREARVTPGDESEPDTIVLIVEV